MKTYAIGLMLCLLVLAAGAATGRGAPMIHITVPAFQGMAPRVSPALLEPTQGVSWAARRDKICGVNGGVKQAEKRRQKRPQSRHTNG